MIDYDINWIQEQTKANFERIENYRVLAGLLIASREYCQKVGDYEALSMIATTIDIVAKNKNQPTKPIGNVVDDFIDSKNNL